MSSLILRLQIQISFLTSVTSKFNNMKQNKAKFIGVYMYSILPKSI